MESEKILEIIAFKENKSRLLGRLLNKSYRYMSEVATDFLKDKGYTDFRVGHIVALVHIEFEGDTVNTLALRAGITKQGMSKIVKELVEGEYVISEKHPSDARSVIVKLTDRGYEALTHWKACTEHIDKKFTEILGSERLEQVKDILGVLVDYYEKNVNTQIENEILNKIMFVKG
jgi:DNA-binding MarR family transcriptional regulator